MNNNILLLIFNVFLAIFVIFLNKLLFSSLKFNYPVAKTTIDYTVTWTCTEICRRLGLYKQTPWSKMPLNKNMISLVIVVAIAVPLNNLSLSTNAIGTYQLLKLLVTPTICFFEYFLNNDILSLPRTFSLIFASIGVALFTVKDVEIQIIGIFWALIFLPAAAYYKVQWKIVQNSINSCTVLSLIHRVYPIAIPVLIPFHLIIDPPGLFSFQFTTYNTSLLLLSGVAIFMICKTSLEVVMQFSPLTHQVLGLVKVSISVILGVLLLGNEVPDLWQGIGLFVALSGTGLYARITTVEKRRKERKKRRKVKRMSYQV